MVVEVAEESKEEMAEAERSSPEEPTGEIHGHKEGNVAGRGNSYTKKGWTDDTSGVNGDDGGGGPGPPTG